MRLLIQRVSKASVTIGGTIKASIGTGLLLLVGIEERDGEEDIQWLAGKVSRMRLFDDAGGIMNLSVQEVRGGLLVISQFTLHASTKKGNRPSYIRAARPEQAVPLYQRFLQVLEESSGIKIASGEFGTHMEVMLVNDGPVTIFIDSKERA
jgi:D-aminoacyl-tRNA deacylase